MYFMDESSPSFFKRRLAWSEESLDDGEKATGWQENGTSGFGTYTLPNPSAWANTFLLEKEAAQNASMFDRYTPYATSGYFDTPRIAKDPTGAGV